MIICLRVNTFKITACPLAGSVSKTKNPNVISLQFTVLYYKLFYRHVHYRIFRNNPFFRVNFCQVFPQTKPGLIQSGTASFKSYESGNRCLQKLFPFQVKNGHIRRVIDEEVKSLVLEISGTNVATTFITTPIMPRASLAIRLPFLVMIIKNMKKYFTFEIQILGEENARVALCAAVIF